MDWCVVIIVFALNIGILFIIYFLTSASLVPAQAALLHTLARNVQHDSRLVEKGEELVEWLRTADEAGMPDVKPDEFTYAG
jgi:hypothetical protein